MKDPFSMSAMMDGDSPRVFVHIEGPTVVTGRVQGAKKRKM